MPTPTIAELNTAIEVLRQLAIRFGDEAACSQRLMPKTQLGKKYARTIEMDTDRRILRIESVKAQLRDWRDELAGQNQQLAANSAHPPKRMASARSDQATKERRCY